MSNKDKVSAFLPWFTEEPKAEAPLKLIIMLSSCKNHLRLVSNLFKSHAEEGTTKITWEGNVDNEREEEEEEEAKPSSLMPILTSPVRDRDGRLKDRHPKLKSIHCEGLDTLMDLNGCPRGLEELSCKDCRLIKSLAPLSACIHLRMLNLFCTKVSSLKPLMGCVKLEWLEIGDTSVSDLSPLSACINLQEVSLACTPVSDLSPLSGLHQLRSIDVAETEVTDLSPLRSLIHLEFLDCFNTKVSDLTPLSPCSELRALDICHTNVKSLSPLLQCKKLKYLNHSNLLGKTEGETKGYIDCITENLLSDLQCISNDDNILHIIPSELIHGWKSYSCV